MSDIIVISGTNRAGSRTLKIAQYLTEQYKNAGENVSLIDLQTLPPSLLDPGAYFQKPADAESLLTLANTAKAVHIVVPEYNGTFPGVLKLFIDHWKYPEGFDGKSVAYIGIASGRWAGLRAVEHLHGVFGYRQVNQYPKSVYIPAVHEVVDKEGNVLSEEIKTRIETQIKGFLAFSKALA